MLAELTNAYGEQDSPEETEAPNKPIGIITVHTATISLMELKEAIQTIQSDVRKRPSMDLIIQTPLERVTLSIQNPNSKNELARCITDNPPEKGVVQIVQERVKRPGEWELSKYRYPQD